MKQRPRSPPPLTLLSFRRKLRPKESKDITHHLRFSSLPESANLSELIR